MADPVGGLRQWPIIEVMLQPVGPMVGRDEELARLERAAGIPDRRGGLVVLSGDAGIGKTRLLHQLATVATTSGFTVVTGHCVGQSGAAVPYLPFIELLSRLDEAQPDVLTQALDVHPTLAQLLPGRRLALETPLGSAGPGLLGEAAHACLTLAARTRPLLVVVEDVHWGDRSSHDLLTLLLTRGFTTPVSLVVSYRSDDLHRRHPLQSLLPIWTRLPGVARIELPPLAEDAMRTLVHRLGVECGCDEETMERIVHRADGNAFFAEELVASGSRTISGDLSRVLQTRFEQLDEASQLVVRAMSVCGRRVPHDLLEAVVGLSPAELDAALRAAIDHQTIALAPPDGYEFRHALVGEAIADDLLPGERTRLHRAFAEALAERPGLAPASELARHAAAAGDLTTAIAAGRRAGEDALAIGGPREALAHFEAVLSRMREDHPQRDEVTLLAAQAASACGDSARAVHLINDRLEHPGVSSAAGRARLLAAYVTLSRFVGTPADAVARAEEALRLTEGSEGPERLEALRSHVQALVDQQRFAEAQPIGEEALALADRLGRIDITTDLRTILSRLVEVEVDPATLEAHLAEIIRSGSAADGPTRVRAYHRLADLEQDRGNLRAALGWFDKGAEIGAALHREWAPFELWCRLRGALIAYELGDLDGALLRLELPGPPYPQPGHALVQSARLAVLAARDLTVDPAVFDSVRPWWVEDALLVVHSLPAQLDLLGRAGRAADALDLCAQGVEQLDRQWSDREQALLRIAATLIGVLADASAAAGPHERARFLAAADHYRQRAQAAVSDPSPPFLGPESRAWLTRLDAEYLRCRWAVGRPGTADELIAAWRTCVEAFEGYGHPYETARSRARLAQAYAAAGDRRAADVEAAAVRESGVRLGSAPLVALASAIEGTGGPVEVGPEHLTRREQEILAQLARGRSNGQIGQQLFITTKTASVHVSNILAKLGAASRGEAVAIARKHGLLPSD